MLDIIVTAYLDDILIYSPDFDMHVLSVWISFPDAFTSTPILVHPDPEKPSVVEVDASDVGVSAILSQSAGSQDKLSSSIFLT